jgi:DNA-3-methyladenine glycosylase
MKIQKEFYLRDDVLLIAFELIGKLLCSKINGKLTSGIIVETEAYRGPEDKASHAFAGRRTARTETMFKEGGCAYVYLCYGMHNLFNVVTNVSGIPHAVLIRALEPVQGIEFMKERVLKTSPREMCAGPGLLTKAMSIKKDHDSIDLTGNTIWLEDHGRQINEKEVITSERVGVSYAEEYSVLPWRFRLKSSQYTSKAK